MTFTYNELHQRTSQKTPLGNITTWTYDAEGQVLTVKDPLSRVMTHSYTNRGMTHVVIDVLGNRVTLSYDAALNRSGSQDSGGSVAYSYDALDRVLETTDQLGNKTTFTYDAVGNRTSVKDALSHIVTSTYDARNRLIAVTDALSQTTTFVYDGAGNRTVVTDPLSRSTTSVYDAANRLTSITQPDPDDGGSLATPITTFTYDNVDRMTSLKDPVNNVTSWTYDAAGRVLTEVDPHNKTTSYTYNAAGELTKIVDRKNQRREFVYDDDGRRTQEKWCTTATGSCTTSRIFTYTYNAASELTEVNETDSRYTFTYDDMGRMSGMSVLGSNMPSVRLTNTYDGLGRRTAVEDDLSTAGKISFTYDAANRMTNAKMTVGGTVGPQVTLTYDAANRLTNLTRQDGAGGGFPPPNQVLTTFTYDNADRMTAITHTYKPGSGSSSTLATYTYGYNAASELTSETNQDGTYTYTYDKTGQLTGVDASGGTCGATGCDESFRYDVNGNRTMSGYTTGTGNRLTSDGTYNYTCDDNGNMLTKTRISDSQKYEFTWDYRNRLAQVVLKNSGGAILQQTDFTYDTFNRRIIKSYDPDGPGEQSATVTKTVYDGAAFAANPYADFDGSNNLTMRYLYGPAVDFILGRRNDSGTVAWYLADHLGTVRDIANPSGAILDHVGYSVFGQVTAETSSSNGDRFKFAAREYDGETGQYHYRARPYGPAIGRFINEDPISFAGRDANLYRYVGNQPGRFSDPFGLQQQVPPSSVTQRSEARNAAIHVLANADGAVNEPADADPSARRLRTGMAVIAGTGTAIQLAVPILMEAALAELAGAGIPWAQAAQVGVRLPGWLARLFGRTKVTIEILDDAGNVIRTMTASSGDEAAMIAKYVRDRIDFLKRIEEKFRGMSRHDINKTIPAQQHDALSRTFGVGVTRRGADSEAIKDLTQDTIEKYAEISRRMIEDGKDPVHTVRLEQLLGSIQ